MDSVMRDWKDVLRMSLMFVKSICVGDGEATIFLLSTRKGVLIDSKVYDELGIKDVRIVIWDTPLCDSSPSKYDAYATITIDSIDEYNAEAIVAYSCLRNGWEGSYKIDFMKNGKWRMENLETLTIA